MKRWTRRAALLLLTLFAGLVAVIAFDAPVNPVEDQADLPASTVSAIQTRDLPPRLFVKARDGAPIAYRLYGGRSDRAIVLVHGSTGTSADMNEVAKALQAGGATVYSLDLRGHGGSGLGSGQVSYVGQLDDDLQDFLKGIGLDKPDTHRTMAGFSMGGGFVLRTASSPNSNQFEAYLAISPYIPNDTSFSLDGRGYWVNLAKPRILALHALEAIGLPWFQYLIVASYHRICASDDICSPRYSYGLRMSLHLHGDAQVALARIDKPTRFISGGGDQPVLDAFNPRIRTISAGDVDHVEMVRSPESLKAIVAAWQDLAGR